jgi:eukaryotic-like serine/threonine-protein kinase
MTEARLQPDAARHPATDLSGTSVGRFVIHSRLGQGGMGEVYRADDTRLKRTVALKRIAPALHADERSRRRLWKEAECASRLSDPHIAAVYDVIEQDNELFVVMEFVEGQTLRRRIQQPLKITEFLPIAIQCAEALAAAQKSGILHHDIKPENIMLTPEGQVKILDFGLARPLVGGPDETTLESLASGALAGTPAYMAPEVLDEKVADSRSDIFSLGLVFYEALGGRNPFRAEGFLETCNRILHLDPVPLRQLNPEVPVELERIIFKMLAKDPAERYSSAADLAVDLRAEQTALTRPALPIPPVMRTRSVLWAGGVVAALLLLAALAPPAQRQVRNWLGLGLVPPTKQVAVLPFNPVSSSPQTAAFGAGLTETLTAKLTQLTAEGSLQVVPATELRARHVSTVDDAHKVFGVNLVLEGSLYESGDRVRINYTLVDARTRRQLRADSLTVAANDPFTAQDEVVKGAVQMLQVEIPPDQRRALESHGTQVAGAYEYYLQGRGYLQDYDKAENLDNAVNVFERALSLDGNYALAYAGLGDTYFKKYSFSKNPKWLNSSKDACEHALRLNSELPSAHVCRGVLYQQTGAYQQAGDEFQRALAAEPTNDDAYRDLASAYESLGKPAEAEKTYRRAIELRAHYWAGYSWLGVFYYRQARFLEAAEMFQQVTKLVPDSYLGYSNLGATYVEESRYTDAIAVLEQSIAIRPFALAYTNQGNAYFYLKRYEEADHAYEQAVKLQERDPLLWWNLGDGYYWTPGKRAQAAAAYRRAIALSDEMLRVNSKDPSSLGVDAICHAMLGEKKAALQSLQQGLKYAPNDPELRFKAALVYNQLGDINSTVAWLEKALAVRYSPSRIRDTPNFAPLQTNPRFQKLVEAK